MKTLRDPCGCHAWLKCRNTGCLSYFFILSPSAVTNVVIKFCWQWKKKAKQPCQSHRAHSCGLWHCVMMYMYPHHANATVLPLAKKVLYNFSHCMPRQALSQTLGVVSCWSFLGFFFLFFFLCSPEKHQTICKWVRLTMAELWGNKQDEVRCTSVRSSDVRSNNTCLRKNQVIWWDGANIWYQKEQYIVERHNT